MFFLRFCANPIQSSLLEQGVVIKFCKINEPRNNNQKLKFNINKKIIKLFYISKYMLNTLNLKFVLFQRYHPWE